MTEYERVRKNIACISCGLNDICYDHNPIEDVCSAQLQKADQILGIKGLEIKSDDQSLPEKPPYLTLAQGGYKQALVDICEAGFVKVIPKK